MSAHHMAHIYSHMSSTGLDSCPGGSYARWDRLQVDCDPLLDKWLWMDEYNQMSI